MHGEVFKNPLFDFIQAVVISIQNGFGLGQVQAHLTLGGPGHCDQPINIRPHHRGLGRHRRHLLELVQLSQGLGVRLFAQSSSVDTLLQLIELIVAVFAVAQFFLNGLHLLIQVVLALTALHLLFDPTTDALLDLQQVDFRIQQRQHMLDAGSQIGDFKNFLLLLDLQHHVRRHGVDQTTRLINAIER